MKLRNSLTLSLLLHALPILIILFLTGGGNNTGGGTTHTKDKDSIQAKPNKDAPTEVTLVKLPGKQKPKPRTNPSVPHSDEQCDDFYGGIGIVHNYVDNTVTEAPLGYPAANAGIKPGDRILSRVDELRGTIGTEVELIYQNEDGLHQVILIRDKICLYKQELRSSSP